MPRKKSNLNNAGSKNARCQRKLRAQMSAEEVAAQNAAQRRRLAEKRRKEPPEKREERLRVARERRKATYQRKRQEKKRALARASKVNLPFRRASDVDYARHPRGKFRGNPSLVGLSPTKLNKNKRVCECHFRKGDILPSGRLIQGAIPIPYTTTELEDGPSAETSPSCMKQEEDVIVMHISSKYAVKNKIKNRKEEEEEDNTPNESFAFVNVKEENISISSSEDCSIVEDDFTNNLNNTSSMSKSSRDPRPGDVVQGTPLPQQATSVTARRPHTLTTRQLPSQSHNTLTPQVPSQSHNTLTPQVPSQSHNTLTPQAPSQPLASPPGPSNALSDNSTEPLHKKPKLSKQTELLDLACTYLIEKCSGQKQPPEEGDDEFLMIAKVWAKKLRALDPLQRKFAEKYVNDILFEADIGTLNRDSVKINRS